MSDVCYICVRKVLKKLGELFNFRCLLYVCAQDARE